MIHFYSLTINGPAITPELFTLGSWILKFWQKHHCSSKSYAAMCLLKNLRFKLHYVLFQNTGILVHVVTLWMVARDFTTYVALPSRRYTPTVLKVIAIVYKWSWTCSNYRNRQMTPGVRYVAIGHLSHFVQMLTCCDPKQALNIQKLSPIHTFLWI